MKWLEGIEYEVTHVLVHVGPQYTSVKVVDGSSTVHHLSNEVLE